MLIAAVLLLMFVLPCRAETVAMPGEEGTTAVKQQPVPATADNPCPAVEKKEKDT